VQIDRPDGDDGRTDALDTASVSNPAGARDLPYPPDPDAERQARIARAMESRGTADAAYRAYAIRQAYEKISGIEHEAVTPVMKRIEAEDPERRLAGLENSLKGMDRLAEKVTFDVQKKGVTVDQAVANVKDAIRYTFCYSEHAYTAGVYADCDRLTDAGFELIERRNSWDKDQYKGINSRWLVPVNSQMFELQFHTQASLDAKEETHWAYEKLRVGVPTSAEQHELEDYQKRITARIPVPPGAQDIPDYP
jgi:hypothetical protein